MDGTKTTAFNNINLARKCHNSLVVSLNTYNLSMKEIIRYTIIQIDKEQGEYHQG